MRAALLIIDMLNDFVYGRLATPTNKEIIPNIKRILIQARKSKIPVIYVCDSHLPEVDWELKLWGPHAIVGTKGAEVVIELKPEEGDFIIKKRRYSGFFQTDLGILLRELGVDTLLLTGIDTSICIRHTAADAFFRGYSLIIPKDAVNTFDPKDNEQELMYLERIYGAKIITTEELISRLGSE
ncbi:MAG: cysteine hydrolase family protein [Candidatus Methanomethylicaceae archaeon]